MRQKEVIENRRILSYGGKEDKKSMAEGLLKDSKKRKRRGSKIEGYVV